MSTYEISIDEVVSTGPSRLIVFEGAEERVTQLTVGVLERLGIGRAPWERDLEEEYGYSAPRTVSPANQLPSGVPLEPPKPKVRTPEPVAREEEWTEDYVEEERPQRQVMEARYYESIQYEEEEEDNWSEATSQDKYQTPPQKAESQPYKPSYSDQYDDHDVESDIWDDVPKPVNIPKKVKEKQPEYEIEEEY